MQILFNTGEVSLIASLDLANNRCNVLSSLTGAEPTSATVTKQVVDKIQGSWDAHSKNYILSIQPAKTTPTQLDTYQTINFDDGIKGWVSFLLTNQLKLIV